MKIIKLKILSKDDPLDKVDYKEMIEMISKSPNVDRNGRPQGLTLDEVRKGVRILKACETATDELKLEDADYKFIFDKANKFTWAKASENIVTFMDDLQDAEEEKK